MIVKLVYENVGMRVSRFSNAVEEIEFARLPFAVKEALHLRGAGGIFVEWDEAADQYGPVLPPGAGFVG